MSDKENMKKHMNKVVCRIFEGGKRYHGRVVGVEFLQVYVRRMYCVVHTDGGKESYRRGELALCVVVHTAIHARTLIMTHDNIMVST